MSVTESFGLTVRKYRELQKISQEEFANRAGLDRTYISGIERGRRNPSLITIERLATALGIDLGTLFQMMCKTHQAEGKRER